MCKLDEEKQVAFGHWIAASVVMNGMLCDVRKERRAVTAVTAEV
jgi:hypothetical protein